MYKVPYFSFGFQVLYRLVIQVVTLRGRFKVQMIWNTNDFDKKEQTTKT